VTKPQPGACCSNSITLGWLGLQNNIWIYSLYRWLIFNQDWSRQFWENWYFTFGPLDDICWFPENANYEHSVREMVSINYWNLIKIIRAVFGKITILFYGAHLKDPDFFKLQ
jgi:hypothetical protein